MKVAIVVLILVAILFGVAVGLGFTKKSDVATERDKAKNGNPPFWTKIFADKDGKSLMPGMKIKGKEHLVLPRPDGMVVIEPSTEPFRLLKLAHESGGDITVSFQSKEPPPKTPEKMDDPQVFTLIPEGSAENHEKKLFYRTSVVVFKSGGTLTLTLAPGPPGPPRTGAVKVE